MTIRTARYISSSPGIMGCPPPALPEFAFAGRSNVGKSSLINMLTGRKRLALISQTPGKTRTINHFLINDKWYLADLPGYGYAKTSASDRKAWKREIENYILKRSSIMCVFVLVDIRINPQKHDLEFMEMLGLNHIPFARVFTKADKISRQSQEKNISAYNKIMLERWEECPVTFVTSAVQKTGREELLDFIEDLAAKFRKNL